MKLTSLFVTTDTHRKMAEYIATVVNTQLAQLAVRGRTGPRLLCWP